MDVALTSKIQSFLKPFCRFDDLDTETLILIHLQTDSDPSPETDSYHRSDSFVEDGPNTAVSGHESKSVLGDN